MSLVIGGFLPFSTIDYPGKLSAVVFCQGCPWRCPYCHNKALQPFETPKDAPTWEGIVSFLESRRGQLDAVVFSGGEPTTQLDALVVAMANVKHAGFKVGLHTNGENILACSYLARFVDWVGLDIKAPRSKYAYVVKTTMYFDTRDPLLSLFGFVKDKVPLEARTTWAPSLLTLDDAATMAREIAEAGAPSWTIQRCTGDMTDLEVVAHAARDVGTGMEIKVRG